MRRLDSKPTPALRDLDSIPFKSLYAKQIYDAPTRDGWVLRISRYKPAPQAWEQPIFGQPLVLVPGWSQNRHAFTCGNFVKQLLACGPDIHILELRGHGLSSRELQLERGLRPADLDWEWDLDSYFLHDLPAGIEAVKKNPTSARPWRSSSATWTRSPRRTAPLASPAPRAANTWWCVRCGRTATSSSPWAPTSTTSAAVKDLVEYASRPSFLFEDPGRAC